MSVTIMCSATEPGAVDVSEHWKGSGAGSVHLRTLGEGLTLSIGERNGRDDSDFYAVVWNPDEGQAECFEYATTRGWTYPNYASEDAYPSVRAAYREAQIRSAFFTLLRDDEIASREPGPGKHCRVIKGRKIAKGALVTVKRLEAPVSFGYNQRTVNARVCDTAEPANVSKWVFTNVENLEVVSPELYLTNPEDLLLEAERLVDGGYTVMPKRLVAALNRR